MFEAIVEMTGSTYQKHQTLESLLRRSPEDDCRRYIFMETDSGVLVRSPEKVGSLPWREKATPGLNERVRIVFRGLPVRKRGKRPDRPKTQRTVLTAIEDQREWARSRLEANGLRMEDGFYVSDYTVSIKNKHEAFIKAGIEVFGFGVVTDETLFAAALLNGIGEAKPYGFGTIFILENTQ